MTSLHLSNANNERDELARIFALLSDRAHLLRWLLIVSAVIGMARAAWALG